MFCVDINCEHIGENFDEDGTGYYYCDKADKEICITIGHPSLYDKERPFVCPYWKSEEPSDDTIPIEFKNRDYITIATIDEETDECKPVDLVLVIRCKDCKHFHSETVIRNAYPYSLEDGAKITVTKTECMAHELTMPREIDFCSRAEQKQR